MKLGTSNQGISYEIWRFQNENFIWNLAPSNRVFICSGEIGHLQAVTVFICSCEMRSNICVNYFCKGGPRRVEKCTKPCNGIGPPKKAIACHHMWAKLTVPTFLTVAMSFAVQGDWAIAFCRQFVFFFPGPKAGGLYKLNWTQRNSELKRKIAWNPILDAVYVFWFNSICIFLCFLFFFFLIFPFYCHIKPNAIWFWIQSWIQSFSCLICRLFFLRFLSLFLPAFFLPAFFLPAFFLCFSNCPFCSIRSSFLCFLDHQSVPI